MPHTRKHELAFGDMKVSIASFTALPEQKIQLEITGIADRGRVEALPAEGTIISTDRLIQPRYRDAVNLIRQEIGEAARGMGCEKNDYHATGIVRQDFMVPKMKLPLGGIIGGIPERREAETKNTKAVFDALRKKLDELAPEIEKRLARSEKEEHASGSTPPYLKGILEQPEDRRERLKKEITVIAPEIADHHIDTLVSYVEEQIDAARSRPPSIN